MMEGEDASVGAYEPGYQGLTDKCWGKGGTLSKFCRGDGNGTFLILSSSKVD